MMEVPMDEVEFPKEDRQLFQLLTAHPHLMKIKQLAEAYLDLDPSIPRPETDKKKEKFERNMENWIKGFCERYQCRIRVQVVNWEQIGLHPFFVLTPGPIDHPYAVRRYEIVGEQLEYLTLLLTPDPLKLSLKFPSTYDVSYIYRPYNEVQLLYKGAWSSSYNDQWLLNLREVMVEGGLGEIRIQHEDRPMTPIIAEGKAHCLGPPNTNFVGMPVTRFLEKLQKIYLKDEIGLFGWTRYQNEIPLIRDLEGFLVPYLDLKLEKMKEYLLIFEGTSTPLLFAGGVLKSFPLTEGYEMRDALICRFQTPEACYPKLALMLLLHLKEHCDPFMWQLHDDIRMFHLQEQWTGDRWEELDL